MGGLDVDDGPAVAGHCSDCGHVIHCLKSQQQVYCRDCGQTNPINSKFLGRNILVPFFRSVQNWIP